MRQFTGSVLSMLLLAVFLAAPVTSLHAQRISPDTEPPQREESSSDDSDQSEGRQRLILPESGDREDTSDDEEEQSMYNRARIEELKADSAAMRVEFEETISELRSDSEAMRERYEERIDELEEQINSLQEEIESLRESQQASTQEDTSSDREELELPGTVEQADTGEETSGETTDTDSSSEEQASEGTLFNPNTASLSDLKSIPNLSDRLAERIEWYRREVRPFKSRNDLQRVPGIDRQTFEEIVSYFHEGPY